MEKWIAVISQNFLEQLANRKSASLEQDSAHSSKLPLKEHLNDYHKFLVKEFLDKSKKDQLKTLMNPEFLLGFSEHQILQVVANAFKMFTLDDVCCYVEIWNMNRAFKILDILSQVFGDICEIDENFFFFYG